MRRVARSLWRHLTRSRAQMGWALALIGILLFGLYPSGWLWSDPFKQLCLIVASVALGAIFLPDITSSLWGLKAEDVKDLVPEAKVRTLQATLVESQVNEARWASHITHSGLFPLIEAGKQPALVMHNVLYSANIRLSSSSAGTGSSFNYVETRLTAERVIPRIADDERYYVAVARDEASLQGEFDQPGCLLRDVVDTDKLASDDEWKRVVSSSVTVELVMDGLTLKGQFEPVEATTGRAARSLRAYFDSEGLRFRQRGAERRLVTVNLDYPLNSKVDRFVALFGGYYSLGTTQVDVRLSGPPAAQINLNYQLFFSHSLGMRDTSAQCTTSNHAAHLVVTTPAETLLWPGSGVVF